MSRRPLGCFGKSLQPYFHEMYTRMFVPYFLLPLYRMEDGKHALARTRLFETTMNASDSVITPEEVFSGRPSSLQRYRRRHLARKLSSAQRSRTKTLFLRLLNKEVHALNVLNGQSNYRRLLRSEERGFWI